MKRGLIERLLPVSRGIDGLSATLGRIAAWCVLAACLLSCANTMLRYGAHFARPLLLDLPMFVFALIVLGAAPRTLAEDSHIRVDILWRRLSPARRAIVDILGNLLFLIPFCLVMIVEGTPFFMNSWRLSEGSATPGGLPLWPIKALIPLAFALLLLQAVSALVTSVATALGNAGTDAAADAARPGG